MPRIGTSVYSAPSTSSSDDSDYDEEFKAELAQAQSTRQGPYDTVRAPKDGVVGLVQRYRLHAIGDGYRPQSGSLGNRSPVHIEVDGLSHDSLAQRGRILGYLASHRTDKDDTAIGRVVSRTLKLINSIMSGDAKEAPGKHLARIGKIRNDMASAQSAYRQRSEETMWGRLRQRHQVATGEEAGWLNNASRLILRDYAIAIVDLRSALDSGSPADLKRLWDRYVSPPPAPAPGPGRSANIPIPFIHALEESTADASLKMLIADRDAITTFSIDAPRNTRIDGTAMVLSIAGAITRSAAPWLTDSEK